MVSYREVAQMERDISSLYVGQVDGHHEVELYVARDDKPLGRLFCRIPLGTSFSAPNKWFIHRVVKTNEDGSVEVDRVNDPPVYITEENGPVETQFLSNTVVDFLAADWAIELWKNRENRPQSPQDLLASFDSHMRTNGVVSEHELPEGALTEAHETFAKGANAFFDKMEKDFVETGEDLFAVEPAKARLALARALRRHSNIDDIAPYYAFPTLDELKLTSPNADK